MFEGRFVGKIIPSSLERFDGLAQLNNAGNDRNRVCRIYAPFTIGDSLRHPVVSAREEWFFYGHRDSLIELLGIEPLGEAFREFTVGYKANHFRIPIGRITLPFLKDATLSYCLAKLPQILQNAYFVSGSLPKDEDPRKAALVQLLNHYPKDFVERIEENGRCTGFSEKFY